MEPSKARIRVVPLLLLILVAAGLGTFVYYAPVLYVRYYEVTPTGELRSGGTSSAAFLIDKWKDEYRKKTGIKLPYQNTGSSEGINGVINRTYAIGFTHNPLSENQRKKAREAGGEVLHIPVAICAVVPIYHLKELQGKEPVNFTREVLADIFLGKITRWNDPALEKINKKIQLPDKAIYVIYRKDKSGTTQIFTEYLQGASAEWDKKIGPAASKVDWPVGEGEARSVDVAAHVQQKEGAIGYTDLIHAHANRDNFSYGAVQNKDKTAFLHADADNMTAAANGLADQIGEDLTFNLANKSGKDAYPICGGIWAVCYQKQPAETYKIVADFLTWATHDGQKFTKERTYAPLPDDIIKRVDERLKLLKAS